MVDPVAKKHKKSSVTEEDVCTLLQKYSATQVLVLLREVAQSPEVKIDWSSLVKKSGTGIENARECQMLWRHLAYRHPLLDKIEPGVPPLDDDSDLEFELEASPSGSTEVTMEAANCVKVLAMGTPNESVMPSSSAVEGDLLNAPTPLISWEHPQPSLLQSSNMTLSVSLQKQPQPVGTSGEVLDANGAANNFPSRRKRKPWSEEEDLLLINAVRKHGEGIWATIVKAEFNGNRTAAQLSQRWAILRKKQGGLNVGIIGSQLSEQQLATRHALEQALKNTLKAGCGTVGSGAAGASNSARVNASNKDSSATNVTAPAQQQSSQVANATSVKQQPSQVANTSSVKPGASGSTSTPRPPSKKAAAKPTVTADSIQATAVAVGARIASLSDAESLFKAAQAKNTVHIRGGGGSLIKSSAGNSTSSLPPNVHFIRTGLASTPSTAAAGTPSIGSGGHQAKGNVVKPYVPAASVSQFSGAKTTAAVALERNSATTSSFGTELQQIDVKISAEIKVSTSEAKPVVEVLQDTACRLNGLLKAPLENARSTSPSGDVNLMKPRTDGVNPQLGKEKELTETKPEAEVCVQATENAIARDSNEKSSAALKSDNSSVDVRHEVSPNLGVDGGVLKMEFSSESLAEAGKTNSVVL